MHGISELRKAGLKSTHPRLRILGILAESATRHITAEALHKQLIDSGEEIGLATVYRVLTQFESANLVVRHNFETGRSIFELNDQPDHDHMVCVECGKVFEFLDRAMTRRHRMVAETAGFSIADHQLYLYGVCRGVKNGGRCSMPPKRDLGLVLDDEQPTAAAPQD